MGPLYPWKEKSCTSHRAASPPPPAALLGTDTALCSTHGATSPAGSDLLAWPSKACPGEANRMDSFHLAKVLGLNWGGDHNPASLHRNMQPMLIACGHPPAGSSSTLGRAVSLERQRVRKQLCAVTSSASHSACGSPALCTKISGRKRGAEKTLLR